MRRTEHYNLGINEGTDIVNGLIPFNENMETIDNELFKLSGGVVVKATETSFQNNILSITSPSNIFYFASPINYSSNVTININGVERTCVTPDGKSLNQNCFVINSNVLVIDNIENNTATFIVGQNDAYSLGGFLPNHYATQESVNNLQDDIDNLANMFNIQIIYGQMSESSIIINMGIISKILMNNLRLDINSNKYFLHESVTDIKWIVAEEFNDPNNIFKLEDYNFNYGERYIYNSAKTKGINYLYIFNANNQPVNNQLESAHLIRNNGKLTILVPTNEFPSGWNCYCKLDYIFLNGNISLDPTMQ